MSDINQQITKCLVFIKDRVTDVGSVADKLCEKGVLKMSERESLVGIKSPREQIQGILDIVTKREKGDVFIAVLSETQNEHVAKEITSMEITIGHTDLDRSKTYAKDHADTKEPEPKVLNELVTENVSQLLAPVSQLVDNVSQLNEAVSQLTGIRKPKQSHKPIQRWKGGTKANPGKARFT